MPDSHEYFPLLKYDEFKDTYLTIHRIVQIIGKIKLVHSPWTNHAWQSALLVSPVGFSTSSFDAGNGRSLSIDIDFIRHKVDLLMSTGERVSIPLNSAPVSQFYKHIVDALVFLRVNPHFDRKPNEVADAIPFHKDHVHATYVNDHASSLMQAFQKVDLILKEFRAEFIGKSSPVHFFWGSFDLALTRFSGREAPEHPGHIPNLPDRIVKEAYSHEVSSCGFWPGNEICPYPAFYSYAYPEPGGYKLAKVEPEGAYYDPQLKEFILPYEAVCKSKAQAHSVRRFFQTTYEAASQSGNWDCDHLETDRYLEEVRAYARQGFENRRLK